MAIMYGRFSFATFFHSKNPSTGTRQRRFSKAFLKAAAVATVSARALISFQAIFRSFAHYGSKPHRIRSIVMSFVSGCERAIR